MTDPGKARLLRLLPLLAIVIAAGVGAFTLRPVISFETLKANRDALMAFRDAHYLWSVLGFIAGYAAMVGLSLPGALLATLTGGFLFGLFPGVLYNVAGATVGAILVFLAARWGLGDWLGARLDQSDGRVRRLRDGLRRNELSFLFVMRLVPAVPFFVANLVPALVGVGLWRFAVTTFLGIVPGSLVYTWVGSGLEDVIAKGEMPDMGAIFHWQVLLPILGLAALALLPVVLRKSTGGGPG